MRYRLKDIFNLQMGKTPARQNMKYWDKSDCKWISIADLSRSEKYISNTKEKISDIAVKETGICEDNEDKVGKMSFFLDSKNYRNDYKLDAW